MTDVPFKDAIKKYFVNKETGVKIATVLEELPPLRNGYIRFVHQTSMVCANSILENGLVYNREYAHKSGFSNHLNVASMGIAYDEDAFWDRLTQEGIRHRGSDVIAVFDMPLEECGAHQKTFLAQYLNGTISRGYLVGIVPNYGTKGVDGGVKKLSVPEMQKKKNISQSNPLPPFYETPHWRESIKDAWGTFLKLQNTAKDHF